MQWDDWHPQLLAQGRPFVRIDDLLGAVRDQHVESHRAADTIVERHLHDEFSDHDHTFAEQLGLLIEHRTHLARQLEEWRDGRRWILGRGAADGDADIADALLRATELRLDALRGALDASAQRLQAVLRSLEDDHLRATVHDVTRGREPLAALITRAALDEEQAKLIALRQSLRDLAPDAPHRPSSSAEEGSDG
jgi:hypothetical protein